MYFEWQFKPYSELTTNEFHDIIGLRLQAFVIEQNCCYLDIDGKIKKRTICYYAMAKAI